MLEKPKDFVVFSQANQLIMRVPVQYPSQGELVYLILEMVMNDDEIPDKLVTSVHLPLGLTVSSLNKKQTTFEAIEKHQKLLQESCRPASPIKKSKTEASKRKDQPTTDVSSPKKKKKNTGKRTKTPAKAIAENVTDSDASDP